LNLCIDEIYLGDCVEGMKKLRAETVSLIIADPPFGIDFKAKRRTYSRTESHVLKGYREIAPTDYFTFTKKWMKEAFRLLKESGSMFVFSGWNRLRDILNALHETDFITINHIIWKYQFGVATRRRFVTSHYHCLYVCKNDKKRKFFPYVRFGKEERDANGKSLHYRDKEDVWQIKREYWHGSLTTPTKLPLELIKKIILYTSEEGDLVLDPFLGSGQVAVVSKMLKRHYLGFEIVKEYYDFARARLESDAYRIASIPEGQTCVKTSDLFGTTENAL